MKKVDQTLFPKASEGIRGNCFAACIASIFELPIEDVPHFVAMKDWWGEFQRWLEPRNVWAMLINIPKDHIVFGQPSESAYCVLTGKSPRSSPNVELRHSVVGRSDAWNFVTIFDPHPSRDGLIGEPDGAIIFLPRSLLA